MSNGPLKLQDDEFWNDISQAESEALSLVSRRFLGLVIDAPERVSINQRDTAPVVGCFVRTLRDDRVINQHAQMLVAAVDLETNSFSIGLALDTGKIPAPSTAPPTGDPGEGSTANLFETDLRRVLAIPWQPGRYRVATLLREYLSNPVTVTIGRSSLEYQDPEVERFLEEERRRAIPPPPEKIFPLPGRTSAESFAIYRRQPSSPPIPDQPGIVFNMDRVVAAKPEATCMIHGSFRLPVLRRERVISRRDTGRPPDVGDPDATAVVPVTLVATGSDRVGPWVIRLCVPSYDRIADEDLAEASGYFSIDLYSLPGFPHQAMTYFFSAFSGETIAGPKPVGLVSENMLPR
jgi:hypothetical protein